MAIWLGAFVLFFLLFHLFNQHMHKEAGGRTYTGADRRNRNRPSYLGAIEAKPERPENKRLAYVRRQLLNYSEKEFFCALSDNLPKCYVFPQVSFNALVTHAPHIWSREYVRNTRRWFSTRYVDFVVCYKEDFTVVAVVEYDGSGHRSDQDEKRDTLLKSVGYRVERFSADAGAAAVKSRFMDIAG